jgi:hypothetical protein
MTIMFGLHDLGWVAGGRGNEWLEVGIVGRCKVLEVCLDERYFSSVDGK